MLVDTAPLMIASSPSGAAWRDPPRPVPPRWGLGWICLDVVTITMSLLRSWALAPNTLHQARWPTEQR